MNGFQGWKVGRLKGWLLFVVALLAGCASAPQSEAQSTIDPYIAVAQAEGTSEAAQSKADVYSRILTATAQAPIVDITSTAAAWEMEQEYAHATAQAQMATETAARTATAMSWTPTPNATSTVVAANAQATAAFISNDIRQDNLKVQRDEMINPIKAASFWVALIFLASMAAMFGISWARRFAVIPIPVDGRGNPQPMFDVVEGVAFDADRMANGALATRRKDIIRLLPSITAERQGAVTAQDQLVDLRTRSAAMRRIEESQRPALPAPSIQKPALGSGDSVPLPSWEEFYKWDGDARPLGMGRDGLITTRMASPHVLISGKTGSGKTLYGLRTMVTASLSRGVYVVNVGFSDSGFGVFASHQNYKAIKFNSSPDIIPFLQAVYGELRERVDTIGGKSLDWEHWQGNPPAPFMDIVIDELGNMAEDIYVSDGADAAKRLWRWVSMIANEGRKVGIRFLAALQDPTAKSVDLRFRRNCTLVSFQQGDASQSSAFLGTTGAEALPVGRFMARVDSVTMGGGFAPTDAEIADYLSRHESRRVAAPKWLSTDFVMDKRIAADSLPLIAPTAPRDEIAEMAEKIRGQWFVGMSKSAVSRLLEYPQYGGSYKFKTDAVVEYLNSTTTMDQNGAEMPVLGLVGA